MQDRGKTSSTICATLLNVQLILLNRLAAKMKLSSPE